MDKVELLKKERNIKITYSYDGTDYYGFQRQIKMKTIQGTIEEYLFKITKEKINLISSGRTDTGVHAEMQVSNFQLLSPIPIEKMKEILNRGLPESIVIKDVEEVKEDFHSRFSAKERVYRYYLTWERNPFKNRFTTYVPFEIELKKFLQSMVILKGIHNFKNFRLAGCTSKTQVRELYSVEGEENGEKGLYIQISGSGFLKSQIRIIIGIALDIYCKRKPKNYFEKMLKEDGKYIKTVAPANGLHLWEIKY